MSIKFGDFCGTCGIKHDRHNQRLCVTCHNAYMREWRKTHPLEGEALKRADARQLAKQHRNAGKIVQIPCEACGDPKTEMHHPDYDKPLEVIWLCRPCHLEWHAFLRSIGQDKAA